MASVDPVEGEKGNKAFAESREGRLPDAERPDEGGREAYGVLNPSAASPTAGRSTSTRTARSPTIDKAVKPPTSAEDMLAKLAELKVPAAH